jgi:purine-nucleoside/S-methyl-5'-thioadenosine phosphorylase / adenosine deaminase
MAAVESEATVEALTAVPGLVHGFGLRGPGAAAETRDDTLRRTAARVHEAGRLQTLRQVHGARVATAPWDEPPEADAAVAVAQGLVLGIQTADCLPVLLVDPVGQQVAAAHAGWRGTALGVAREALRALVLRGSRPADVVAALGPGIGVCCYEVGEELREAFGAEGATFFRPGPRGKPHLDVRAANVSQLEAAGLRPESIHHVAECTFCRADRYHSYRRDGPGAGRMISFVGFRRQA